MRIQGEQVETFRVIKVDTQTHDTGGRASYLKREGWLILQNKTGSDKTRYKKTMSVYET